MELDQAEAKPRQPITCREVRLNLEPAPRFRSQLLSFPRKAQNWPPRRREPVYAARGSVWQARLMRARAVPGLPKTTLSHLTRVSFLGTPPTQAHIDLPHPTPEEHCSRVKAPHRTSAYSAQYKARQLSKACGIGGRCFPGTCKSVPQHSENDRRAFRCQHWGVVEEI